MYFLPKSQEQIVLFTIFFENFVDYFIEKSVYLYFLMLANPKYMKFQFGGEVD